jgi:hypothetical protein
LIRSGTPEHAVVIPFSVGGVEAFATQDDVVSISSEDKIGIQTTAEQVIAAVAIEFITTGISE